jgi:hypothetical protein
MVLHIKSYTLHGLISHRDHSNVNHISSSILLNICIKHLIHQSIAQRNYKNLQYKIGEKVKASYWAIVHKKRSRRPIGLLSTRKGKFPERSHPSHVSEVMWLGMSKHVGAVRAKDA